MANSEFPKIFNMLTGLTIDDVLEVVEHPEKELEMLQKINEHAHPHTRGQREASIDGPHREVTFADIRATTGEK